MKPRIVRRMARDGAVPAGEPVAGDLPRDERRRLVLRRPRVGKPPPSRVKGGGWRSVASGAVVAVILGGLAAYTAIPVERIEAVAPWLTLSLMAVLAGKDIGKIADSVVAAARALKGG